MEFTFVRKERKYLLPYDLYEELREEITTYLIRERFKEFNPESFVKSVYFDNSELELYHDHKNGVRQRFKIRIRQYGMGRFYYRKSWIELKEKINGTSLKSRFRLKTKLIPDFLEGRNISTQLIKYNKKANVDQVVNTYHQIRDKIEKYHLEPIIKIGFKREAFRSPEQKVRITFDRNLYFKPMQNSFLEPVKIFEMYPMRIVIMETKTVGPQPCWLKAILSKYKLKKQKFSKYCSSIENIYTPNVCLNINSKEREYG